MMKTVLVGGVFSVIHPGHILFLKTAKSLGDRLVVVLASDETVRKKNGEVFFSAKERAKVVGSLEFVDRVKIGSPKDRLKVVREERPDIIALGFDQDEKGLEKELRERGIQCRVVRIRKHLPDYSTRKIIEKIKGKGK